VLVGTVIKDDGHNKRQGTIVSVQDHKINNLTFADDINLFEKDRDEVQENLKSRGGLHVQLESVQESMQHMDNSVFIKTCVMSM